MANSIQYSRLIKQSKEEIAQLQQWAAELNAIPKPTAGQIRARDDFFQKITALQQELQQYQQGYDQALKDELEYQKKADEKAAADKKAADEKAAATAVDEKKAAGEKVKSQTQPTAAETASADPNAKVQTPNDKPNTQQPKSQVSGTESSKSVSEDQTTPSAQSTVTKTNTDVVKAGSAKTTAAPRPNALSGLATYNYIVELQATDKQGLIRLQQEETYIPSDWVTLISTAGGLGGAGLLRNTKDKTTKWFTKEYYLDDLEFTSIVGINSNARASADTQVTFTITEPYGINLIQELWEFNTTSLKQENWTETCYMLKITFKGFTDQGELKDLGFTKYIPLRIMNIDIKLTSSGSVYTVNAVPFNGQGNDKRYGVLSKGIQCEGKTIYDILLGVDGAIDLEVAPDDYYKVTGVNPLTLIPNPPNLKLALNKEAMEEAEKNKSGPTTRAYPTEYDFDFINDLGLAIGNAIISKPEEIDTKDTSMNLPKDKQEAQIIKNLSSYQLLGQRNSSDIKININNQKVNFNAGQITEILSQLIINSSYVTDQIREFRKNYQEAIKEQNPEARKNKLDLLRKPFNWFRIVPKIYNTGKYDQSSNLDQKRIVYQIVGYEIQNPKGVGGQTVPAAKQSEIEKEIVKEYYYFFTGKNTEIINLDISLNTSYFSYRPRNPEIYAQATGKKPTEPNQNSAGTNVNTNETVTVKDPLNAAKTTVPTAKTERTSSGMGTTTADRNVAGQVASALYSNVDQLSVSLEIVGDPDLIKQDGVFKTAVEDGDEVPISFDNRERYVKLELRNPRDIDDATGTIDKTGSADQNVVFSGLYKILEINSKFSQGKFTQVLKLIRSVSDPEDQPTEISKKQDEAQKSGAFEPPILNIYDTPPNIKDIKPAISTDVLFGKFPPPPSL